MMMGTNKAKASPHLLFGALAGLHRVVDVLHRPLDQTDCIRPLGVRVHTLLCHNSGNVSEHRLQLSLSFPV